MRPRINALRVPILLIGVLLPALLVAQRGNVVIPVGASISVPQGAVLCADTIFANGPGHGTLSLADPTCICSGSVVIPVELLTFSARLRDNAVHLTWTTATETRNYGFEVQRNAGSNDWNTLGFVAGSGSSTRTHSYRFVDALHELPAGTRTLRYRLKQIDIAGDYEYSPEVEVWLHQSLPRFALAGFPSPCDEQLTVHLTVGYSGPVNIRLYDLTGRVAMVIAQDALLAHGSHMLRIQTAKVPSGLYLLVTESGEGRASEKVVIRH
jgi:hypothetical protein